ASGCGVAVGAAAVADEEATAPARRSPRDLVGEARDDLGPRRLRPRLLGDQPAAQYYKNDFGHAPPRPSEQVLRLLLRTGTDAVADDEADRRQVLQALGHLFLRVGVAEHVHVGAGVH